MAYDRSPASSCALTVAICTRDRPKMLADTLAALLRADGPIAEILVIDQSRRGAAHVPAAPSTLPITVIADGGEGISRARNVAAGAARTSWIAFVDDDCVPAPEWAQSLARACEEHPGVEFVSGPLEAGDLVPTDLHAVGLQSVERARVRSGRWTPPLAIGHGASFAVRREAVERLGGWDERLGVGTRPFPAGEDLDFNYRFLRTRGLAFQTPQARVTHRQWRDATRLAEAHAGYLAGNAGCAIKHLRAGDPAGGAWLWLRLVCGVVLMFAGALRSRSELHRSLAIAQARGLVSGTVAAFRRSW